MRDENTIAVTGTSAVAVPPGGSLVPYRRVEVGAARLTVLISRSRYLSSLIAVLKPDTAHRT